MKNFTVLVRRSEATASGNAPIYSGFSLKKVRISFRVRSILIYGLLIDQRKFVAKSDFLTPLQPLHRYKNETEKIMKFIENTTYLHV